MTIRFARGNSTTLAAKITLVVAAGLIRSTMAFAQPGSVTIPNPSATGYVLFAPSNSKITYLINKQGTVINTWTGQGLPGMSVYLLKGGNLLRAETVLNNNLTNSCGFAGGRISLYDTNSNVKWSHTILTETNQQSHDIYPMPNGNVLVDVWEFINRKEAIAAGRNANTITANGFWSGKLVELQPNFATKTATEVWRWRFWDHVNSTGRDPSTLNVNFLGTPIGGDLSDWIHLNAVTYNERLDQIILSSRNLNEIYIIEHTKDTALSAGHTGGRYGKGGDFLYRWGNPQAYGRGSQSDQQLFGQHSPYWIHEDSNRIMINNDGFIENSLSCQTTVNVIELPGNNGVYKIPTNAPFGPRRPAQTYSAPNGLSSRFEGSAQRLGNGNTLICAAFPSSRPAATFYEIDTNTPPNIVWEYQLNGTNVQSFRCHQYDAGFVESIFKPTVGK